jgi:rod shape-determining protein MreC
VISEGARQNVRTGQVLIDANGLIGQVAEVYPTSAVVIGITDADHAIPVMVARSGFRGVLFGQGSDSRLSLANLTPSDDVRAGDILLTSGVGGRFPPGIPVGQVKAFRQDPALTFISAQVQPFARPRYGRHLLLLDVLPVSAPPAPVAAPQAVTENKP